MWSFRVGTVTGIPIRVNVTLLLFLPVLAWLISGGEQLTAYAGVIEALSAQSVEVEVLQAGNTGWLVGALGALGLFASVLVHELGHSWTAMRYDIDIASITLWIFGGMAHMTDLPEEWDKEFWIALAGPVTSVLLGVGFLGLLQVVPTGVPVLVFLVGFLGIVNITLAVFNMLPAFPMDGGRIFRALLARGRPYAAATHTAARVGKGFAVLMGLFGLFGGAPLLVLVALFVYVAAGAESKATALRDLFEGVTVRDLMTPMEDVLTVRGDQTLAQLVDRIVFDRLSAYPVVDAGDHVVGTVTLGSLSGVDPAEREALTIGDVMGDAVTVSADDPAFEALQAFGESGDAPVVVTEDDRVVGVLTREDVARAMEVLQGLRTDSRPVVPDGYA
jgi:Zn-dependent protease/predicted transcriptional regulator